MSIQENLTSLDYAVMIAYLVSVIALGFWVSFRRRHSQDLFLAGRSLGWTNIGLSIWGTNISPSMMIACCSVAYSSGIVMGNTSWLAWPFLLLLAMLFIPHYMHTGIYTMPEFLALRFGQPCRKFLSWYTIFSALVLWLGGTQLAGGKLLSQIMGWPVWVSIIALAALATSFTVAGGLAAVVATDAFQVVLMILGSTLLTIISIHKVGGVSELINAVPDHYWQLFKPADDPEWPWHAVVFGYMVTAIWFWCTDQTIVQRALGAKSTQQGQNGALFAAFLKIPEPLIFFIPGIACFILFPNLNDPDQAYMTMVTTFLPKGLVGLMVAVLIAALVSTVDSGLNSLSTVFTLDIYKHQFHPKASQKETKLVGRIVTVVAALVSVVLAIVLSTVKMDLFSLLESIICFLSPMMATVFLLGILWRRATATAALITLIGGGGLSVVIGTIYLFCWPSFIPKPHFYLFSFYIWIALMLTMIILSLLTRNAPNEQQLPTLAQTYRQAGHGTKAIWWCWALLAICMTAIYIIFN